MAVSPALVGTVNIEPGGQLNETPSIDTPSPPQIADARTREWTKVEQMMYQDGGRPYFVVAGGPWMVLGTVVFSNPVILDLLGYTEDDQLRYDMAHTF